MQHTHRSLLCNRFSLLSVLFCFLLPVKAWCQDPDYKKLMEAEEAKSKTMKDGVPVENAAKHSGSVATYTNISLLAMAKSLQAAAITKIPADLKPKMVSIAAQRDSNAAAIGMLLYANGLDKNAAIYLVSTGIIKNVKDPWAANSLGVLFKNTGDYEKAIACFKYAEKAADSTPVIKTNLGWSAAYYGDLTSAKSYFGKALQLDEAHGGALEGMAMVAYAQGDIATFFQYLGKQLKGFGGNHADEPSSRFIDYVEEAYNTDPVKRKEDPFTDHTLDDPGEEEDAPRGNVGGADQQVEPFPQFNAAFIFDPLQLDDNLDQISQSHIQLAKQVDDASAALSAMKNDLPPLSLPPYADDHGDIITPRNYENEFKLFHIAELLYQRREAWIILKYTKEKIPLDNQVGDMGTSIFKELTSKRDACATSPKSYPYIKTALGMYYTLWKKYHQMSIDNANWFISATSPYVGKVHDVKLNDYLNARRNFLVKESLVTNTYGRWLSICHGIRGMIDTYHPTKACVPQWTPLGMMSDGNDGGSIKHFKKWPEKCYVPTGDFDGEVAAIEMTCEHLKVSFGAGIKLNAQIDFKEDENHDETKIWLSGGIDKDKKIKIGEGPNAVDAVKLKIEAEGELFIKFKGSSFADAGIDLKGDVSGKLGTKTGIDQIDDYMPTTTFKESGNISLHVETGLKGNIAPGDIKFGNVPGF